MHDGFARLGPFAFRKRGRIEVKLHGRPRFVVAGDVEVSVTAPNQWVPGIVVRETRPDLPFAVHEKLREVQLT